MSYPGPLIRDNQTNVTESRFYFVLDRRLCVYVHTEDPLTHLDIAITRPDWMEVCAKLGAAAYVGRERVLGEWADHYNCSVTYNGETDSFQTWHSLGLGTTPYGLPLALSAGDSQPNWEKPRLNSIWYANVTQGPDAVPASTFHVPRVCLPLPPEAQAALQADLGLPCLSRLPSAFADGHVRAVLARTAAGAHARAGTGPWKQAQQSLSKP